MGAPPAGNNPPNLEHLLGNGSAEGHSPFAGLDEGARVVLHIVPFGAFDPAARVDVSSLDRQSLRPIQATGWAENLRGDEPTDTLAGGGRLRRMVTVALSCRCNGTRPASYGL